MNYNKFPEDDRGLAKQRYEDEKAFSEQMVEDIAADIMAKSGFTTRKWLGSDERSEAIWDAVNDAARKNNLDSSQEEYLKNLIDGETSKQGIEND
jgi:hypothetical protein